MAGSSAPTVSPTAALAPGILLHDECDLAGLPGLGARWRCNCHGQRAKAKCPFTKRGSPNLAHQMVGGAFAFCVMLQQSSDPRRYIQEKLEHIEHRNQKRERENKPLGHAMQVDRSSHRTTHDVTPRTTTSPPHDSGHRRIERGVKGDREWLLISRQNTLSNRPAGCP